MPDQAKPVVSALVVNHDAKEQLLACLGAFYANADVPVEAVIVDNNSADGSAAAVTADFPQATVLLQTRDLGYGSAANVGLERCEGRFVLLLSPEVMVDPQCVGRLADFLLTRQDAAAVGPRLLLDDGTLDPEARRSFPLPSTIFYRTVGLARLFPKSPRFGRGAMTHLDDGELHEMDAGSGACLMVRRAALEKVGPFDPRFFRFGEDIDLCYRLKLSGWKIFYLPTAGASHVTAPLTRKQRAQHELERHRSMWAYHHKHHSEGVSAFGNGLVWAQIWGGYVVGRIRESLRRQGRETG